MKDQVREIKLTANQKKQMIQKIRRRENREESGSIYGPLVLAILLGLIFTLFLVSLPGCSDPAKEIEPVKVEKPERGITIDTTKDN